ncbi:MAG: class I SAM-dependent rRNA methyltransferase [Pirellulaceae bacterium]
MLLREEHHRLEDMKKSAERNERTAAAVTLTGAVDRQLLSLDASANLPAIYLKSPTNYPLIYRKRVARLEGKARPGDWVAVYHETQLLGYGVYNPRSEIVVRVLRRGGELPDRTFWQDVLSRAVALRRELLRLDAVTDAYRVIHAESDGISGLVVDRYGETLSAEAFSLGMFQRATQILELLHPLCGTRDSLVRPSPKMLAQEGAAVEPIVADSVPGQVTIQEFGTRFRVRFQGGHKTGFFCDQRENRRKLAEFCLGRTVLDLCCYTGGFAVQAKKLGQAKEVIGVDLDEEPLRLARENANLNQVRVQFVQSDAFAYMRDMQRNGRRFDVIVLDPPKLINSRAQIEEGARKHFDLNRLAMQLVAPGGLLLSCTCAGLLPESEFLRMLYAASRQAGPLLNDGSQRHAARELQILARTGAAADHPVAPSCPETEYLTAVWMRLV